MSTIYFSELDSLDSLLGTDIDVSVHGIMGDPVGRITNVTAPDTDFDLGDDNYPYDAIELEIEDHLCDRTWTRTGRHSINPAIIGRTYTVHYGEARQDDGTWERITDKYSNEAYARDSLNGVETDNQTRFMTDKYEVGLDRTKKAPLRLNKNGLDSVLAGRNTLEETLATVSLNQRIKLTVGTDHRFDATVTDITPEEIDNDPETSSETDGDTIPDNYKIIATDVLDGTLTITYDPQSGTAHVDRTPTDDQHFDYPDHIDPSEDPGKLSGQLHGLSPEGNPVEHYNIPWLNQLESRIKTSDELIDTLLDPGRIGTTIGHVYTAPQNRFELYHVSINPAFQKATASSLSDMVTIDTPHTYGRS